MRYLIVTSLLLVLAGCFGVRKLPDLPISSHGGAGDTSGDFLATIGEWGIYAGGIALILSVAVGWFFGRKAGIGLAVSGAGAAAAGTALVIVGPWMAVVVVSVLALLLVAAGFISWRNRKRISARLESETGLDIDGDGIVGGDK